VRNFQLKGKMYALGKKMLKKRCAEQTREDIKKIYCFMISEK